MNEAIDQLMQAGLLGHLWDVSCEDGCVRAVADQDVLALLRADDRFKEGIFHGLHQDVGQHRTDFRGHRKAFGRGSLQIVIDQRTGSFYADIDNHSPYEDVVGFVGHSVEVIRNWWRG